MEFVEKHDGELVKVHDSSKSEDYASKGVAGAGLGLGIAGTALWLLNGLGSGGGLFGKSSANSGTVVGEIATAIGSLGTSVMEMINSKKECNDVLALNNKMWQHVYDQQQERFADRSVLNQEFFNLYNNTSNKFADVEAKRVQDGFNLYKYSRDNKDELLSQIGDLKAEVAVMKATRPYQDKIIQMAIDNTAERSRFDLFRRTCRMIEGELVLPSTPTVTGYPSYNIFASNSADGVKA